MNTIGDVQATRVRFAISTYSVSIVTHLDLAQPETASSVTPVLLRDLGERSHVLAVDFKIRCFDSLGGELPTVFNTWAYPAKKSSPN